MSEAIKPPPKQQQKAAATYYEKYFDPTHQKYYYYNPTDGQSVWEVPQGSIIADMTLTMPEQNVTTQANTNVKVDKKDLKKKEAEEKKREEYRKKTAAIEQLQMENLKAMYPEFYQNQTDQSAVATDYNNIHQDAYQQENQQVQESAQEPIENASEEQGESGETQQEKEQDREYKLFKLFKNQIVQDLMKRPARRQVKESKKDTAYVEGNYDYNIWYDKYLTDRNQQVEKAPSLYKCQPDIDTGYTKADKFEKKGSTYFCVYFARGACTEGVNCRFYHRIPQEEDLEKAYEDNLRDVFGRARHATHKEDHTGIGSFNKECRTLQVTDIQLPTDSLTPVRDMVRIIYEYFSPWGEIEDIHFNSQKCHAFIKYKHRFYAEFAREAMFDQVLSEGSTEPIAIKWAIDSPFDKSESIRAQQEIQQQQESQKRPLNPGKNKKAQYLTTTKAEEDPHMKLALADRTKMRPEDLVPQLSNPAFKKREQKIMEKDKMKEKMFQQEHDRSQPHEISQGFEQNLFQGGSRYYEGQINDPNKVIENCNRMSSVLQMIEKNYGGKE